jgi:hypothetical protein
VTKPPALQSSMIFISAQFQHEINVHTLNVVSISHQSYLVSAQTANG